jgi:hypothetical protein
MTILNKNEFFYGAILLYEFIPQKAKSGIASVAVTPQPISTWLGTRRWGAWGAKDPY